MMTAWYSFGSAHTHELDGPDGRVTLDTDVLFEITAEDPRAVILELLGRFWSFEYFKPHNEEDMDKYFPRGVVVWDKEMRKIDPDPFDGVFWPWGVDGDHSLPWVERDDMSDRFDTDDQAALYVADLIGSMVMYASLDHDTSGDPMNLRPFVLPKGALKDWEMGVEMTLASVRNRPGPTGSQR